MAAKQGRRNGIVYTFSALSWRTLVLFVCGACLLIVLATHVFPAYRAHVDYKMQRPWFPYSSMEVTVKDSPGEMEAIGKDSPGEANVKDSSVEVTVKVNPTESSDSYTVDYLV